MQKQVSLTPVFAAQFMKFVKLLRLLKRQIVGGF